MDKWIPLMQSAIWPVVALVLLIWFRRSVSAAVSAIAGRMRAGESFRLWGWEMSGEHRAPKLDDEGGNGVTPSVHPRSMYLVHAAVPIPGTDEYRVRIFLDADDEQDLDLVEAVTYHLHPSFPTPVRDVGDRRTSFERKVTVDGEFNMFAEVHMKGEPGAVVFERYINLPLAL